jgi:hypothetical protein
MPAPGKVATKAAPPGTYEFDKARPFWAQSS